MKNRNLKIVTVILACLLLIGGMIGISVSAAEDNEPIDIIARKNVAYEGALKVLYTIDPDAYNAETETVKIVFTVGDSTYTKELSEDTITLDGTTYGIIYSAGIAPKNARQPISATPIVVDKATGEELRTGTVEEYSVWQYAINRFAKEPSDDQKALYTALLDYCGSLQRLFYASGEYTDEQLAECGGFADEYYVTNLYTVVNGETASVEMKTFAEKDLMKGYSDTGLDLDLPKTLNGVLFDGFTDADGNKLGAYGADKTASSWTKLPASVVGSLIDIGTVDIYANYNTDAGHVITYADGLESNVTIGANTSVREDEGDIYYHRLYTSTGNVGNTTFTNRNKTGDVYVFETDITWLGYNTEGETHADWFMKIVIESDASKAVSGDNMLARFFLNSTADDKMLITTDAHGSFKKSTIATVDKGETVNFRIEYIPTGTDASGNYTHTIRSYINGELKSEWVGDTTFGANYDNTTFNSVAFEARGTGNYKAGYDYAIDNTVITILNPIDTYDFEDGNTSNSGLAIDVKDPTALYSVVDDPLHTDTETAASKVLKVEVQNKNQSYDSETVYPTNAGNATPYGVYEISFDFYYDGLTPQSGNKNIMQFIPSINNTAKDIYFQLISLKLEPDGQLTISADKIGSNDTNYETLGAGKDAIIASNVNINSDAWNNIKIVLERNGENTYVSAYVNGEQVGNRANAYNNLAGASSNYIVNMMTWRICNFVTDNGDGTYSNTYDLYIDNFVFKYVGPIAQ